MISQYDNDRERVSSEENIETDESESGEILENSEVENGQLNAAWADSVSKILKTNKPKRKKTIVLSKAKKIN
ncbi:hypothetical protein NQ314_008904 [Rhamnusium bicolor]|uniref:Uncharacterized protein n=1 Tax=Rhamnusium bicolor TaxID=1586634 RepID=A0AAV8Y639_9CUCU|nr:hypothetical protein NQ314_008904 [Rhamnusium bicolor]